MTENDTMPLTKREVDILKLLVNGYSNAEVGDKLGLSRRTVEAYRARIMLKLKINSIPGLVKYALRVGLTTLDEHKGLELNTDTKSERVPRGKRQAGAGM